MKILKQATKYVLVFIILVFVLTTILTLVASIPRKYVEKNLKQAAEYFDQNHNEIRMMAKKTQEFGYIHTYGEEMLLNIIYCLDTNNPLSSVLEAKFYQRYENEGSNMKYIKLVQEELEPNAEYMRYWHGSIIMIKPLLMILSLEQICDLNGILLAILTLALLIVLIRKKYYAIAAAFIAGLIFTACWYVPYSFEYVFPFYIMIITSIIAIEIEHKNSENKNQKLTMLFFITGILTCFFDFLTAEIITILIPLLIVISMRIKNKTLEGTKKDWIFLIKSLAIWFVGYCSMWFAKWLIASLVLKINALDYVINRALIRVNGNVRNFSNIQKIWLALKTNFTTLYFINNIKNKTVYLAMAVLIPVIALIIVLDKKNKEKMRYFLFMLIIAILPYMRYLVLTSHSLTHIFMTFRCQFATIMCLVLSFVYAIDKDRLLTDIKINKRKKD